MRWLLPRLVFLFAGCSILLGTTASALTLVGALDTPGEASDVEVVGNLVYVADSSSGLRVIDVSDPASPIELGAIDTQNAHSVDVAGTLAYVADTWPGLRVIDISNPASPTELGAFVTAADAFGVEVVGTLAYVAAGSSGLRVIDVSNPSALTELGAIDTPANAQGVAVMGDVAYVADGASGLRVIDVSNPAAPVEVGAIDTPANAMDVTVVGTLAYVADNVSGLRVIDVSNPAVPVEIGAIDTPGGAFDVAVVGTLAYVADEALGLRVIDVSNPAAPVEVDSIDTPGQAQGVAVVGDLAYVADGHSGLQIIDIGPEFDPLGVSGSLVIHTQANDQAVGTAFPFNQEFFIARPLGARCNPGNGGATCGTATLQQGAPLTGSVSLIPGTIASPFGFTLPQSVLGATATGSLPKYSPYQYISTHASNARNDVGFFGPGGGPGSYSLVVPGTGGPSARVAIIPGANQFGGVMRLLGAMGAKRAHVSKAKTFVGTAATSFSVLGGDCTMPACLAVVGTIATTQLQYVTAMGKATTAAITSWGFPWTTGTVSITATGGPFPTLFRRQGYDNRTPYGAGTIQLVTPQLARWSFPDRDAPWDRHTGAIGIMRLTFFVPEPSRWLLLAAGLGCLIMLYRLRGRAVPVSRS